jgi:hypothetical protein
MAYIIYESLLDLKIGFFWKKNQIFGKKIRFLRKNLIFLRKYKLILTL